MPDTAGLSDILAGGHAVTGGMPWNRTNPGKERVKFVLACEKRWQAGEERLNLSELCRDFGISRETAYVWLRRYQASGDDVKSVVERSHRRTTFTTGCRKKSRT